MRETMTDPQVSAAEAPDTEVAASQAAPSTPSERTEASGRTEDGERPAQSADLDDSPQSADLDDSPQSAPSVPSRFPTRAVALVTTLVVLLAAALVVLLVVPAHRETGALSANEQRAVDNARQTALNLVSYSRKTFAQDFDRALNSTTGALHDDIAKLRNQTQQQMTNGKFDLTGTVQAAAFESSTDAGSQVLVSVDGYQVDDTGKRTLVSHNRFELNMVDVKGTWLANNLLYIGLI